MAVKVELKLRGVEELCRMLEERKQRVVDFLKVRLLQVAEEAVTYSKENKGYHDRTANLKNSISFALYYDGEIVMMHEGMIPKPEAVEGGQSNVKSAIQLFANQNGIAEKKGFSLIVVAGMEYGVYVEHRGYNVLYLTESYLKEKMGEAFNEARRLFAA